MKPLPVMIILSACAALMACSRQQTEASAPKPERGIEILEIYTLPSHENRVIRVTSALSGAYVRPELNTLTRENVKLLSQELTQQGFIRVLPTIENVLVEDCAILVGIPIDPTLSELGMSAGCRNTPMSDNSVNSSLDVLTQDQAASLIAGLKRSLE